MKNEFNCRTNKRRIEIVAQYSLSPIAHVKLLNGQKKQSCTNESITDAYYCFSYQNRRDKNDSGSFYCGSHAGSDFLKLLQTDSMPEFNPLRQDSKSKTNNRDGKSGNRKWHKESKQLYNAINLIVICWNRPVGGALLDIKNKLELYYDEKPWVSQIKAINTILSRDKKKRTLKQRISEFSKENKMRDFNFDDLNQRLASENITSHFS